jgi:RNase P/RNase MRP subunit p29
MRWPEIFFKSRKPNPSVEKEEASKANAPVLSMREKLVAPSATPTVKDPVASESLRALKQKDSILLVPRPSAEPSLPVASTARVAEVPSARVAPSVSDLPPSDGPAVPLRRKARLTDFARILAPKEVSTKTEPPMPASPPPDPAPAAVVPAAFPVVGTAGSVMEAKSEPSPIAMPPPAVVPSPDTTSSAPRPEPEAPSTTPSIAETPIGGLSSPPSEPSDKKPLTDTTPLPSPEAIVAPPKDRPASESIEVAKPTSDLREKREFILANGERILGHILSETTDTLYLDHPTLGVLTLPRTQIAAKPIEVILINGDRIVGDLIAETTECLYIRHASLGMLTVPHSQRSTRVVEAILKDGDRILGEVLAETDHFTVIRSATLGTVAVQHEQVAMLNRKIEQMQLRTLPAVPALENAKPDTNG